MERLIFLKPKQDLQFSVETNSKDYSPGDQVDITVSVPQPSSKDETFYASVVVTDTSSFLKVPKFKQQPSVPTMIYLEKEIQNPDLSVDELLYASDFIDSTFDPTDKFKQSANQDRNLDMLLAV